LLKKNGRNLAQFILDFKKHNQTTKIRLIGHSLGSEVILSTLQYLFKKTKAPLIESVHFFGASLTSNIPGSKKYSNVLKKMVKGKIITSFLLLQ